MKRILKLAAIAMISVIFKYLSLAENPAGGSGAKLDPCAPLAKDDIAQILGKPVQDGKLNPKANPILGPPANSLLATAALSAFGSVRTRIIHQTKPCRNSMQAALKPLK